MFLLDLSKEAIEEAFSEGNYNLLSDFLYRVQKISVSGYRLVFRHHLATNLDNDNEMRGFASINNFNYYKVKMNCLGEIVKYG